MKDIKKWLLGSAAALVILVLSTVLISQIHRAQAAEHTLSESTIAALADAAQEVQSLALAMDKLALSASPAQVASLLHQTVLSADRARHSLTLLPAEPQALSPILTCLVRMSDSAGNLLTTLGSGLPITSGDMDALTRLQPDLTLLHAELDLALKALLDGETFSSALPATAITAAPSAAELAAYRALPSTTIGTGEALQIAKDFVGADRVAAVAHAPDTTGALPTYGVTIQTSDVQLNLEITQRGGKVLLMAPETAGFAMLKTVDECRASAASFLSSRGFVSMSAAYYQVYDGLCVMTFAHEQENALVWPDRVTVQVRMDTAEVVGLEARSYWKNHMPRRLGSPLLTASEARAALSPLTTEQSVRLAVVPVGAQERLCWQFTVTHNDETYVSFIDAITGREVLLEKMMQLEYGAVPA